MPDELLESYEADRLWRQVRRRTTFQLIRCALEHCSPDLISFEAELERSRAVHRNYRGIRELPIKQIRGSVGRSTDFSNLFLPRRAATRGRWLRVLAVVDCGCEPAIQLYQIDQTYYVLDGHHRLSAMTLSGRDRVMAEVWEFIPPEQEDPAVPQTP